MFYTREFKLSALARLEETGNVLKVACELKVRRALLYQWRRLYKWRREYVPREPKALRTSQPRPMTGPAMAAGASDLLSDARWAQRRIAELEREVGQQRLDLDLFRAAVEQGRTQPQPNGGPGDVAFA